MMAGEARLNVCNGQLSQVQLHPISGEKELHYTDRGRAARIEELKALCRGENGPPVYFR